MAGAAALCGARRCDRAPVSSASPRLPRSNPTVASFEPSYMTYPLPCDSAGCIDFAAAQPVLKRLIEPATVIAVGPGLGQSAGIRALIPFLIAESDKPLVIDADGLNALVGQTQLLSGSKKPIVLTPHPGEFARLSGLPIATVQAERIVRTAAFAGQAEPLVVVLKGSGTVVSDGKRYYVNTTGNPGMATGGSGDVLTGVIAALLAQKLPAFEAAQLGVFIHGVAGDIARDQNGETGLIAGDIVDALADAFVHTMPDAEPNDPLD